LCKIDKQLKSKKVKLWDKGKKTDISILAFTVGKDRELDMELAAFDVIGSIAHVIMLEKVKLISGKEKDSIIRELIEVYSKVTNENFTIEEGIEDVHSQVEKIVTEKLGEAGKKIHSARSRNDQVMLDLKLYYREQMVNLAVLTSDLVYALIENSNKYKDIIIPGYTHMQAAMPSSFGLWFAAYAESLTEDLMFHEGIMEYINQNPLGSAAGYGSSFPVDREMTTRLLEFSNLHINSINAQLSRGKTEKFISAGMGAIAGSLGKMSMDMTLFMSQNFGFLKLNEELTTGSSIMPHKKNPDVLELIRAKSSKISSVYYEVQLLTQNLPSGYHRDFQLLKEILFPAYNELFDCLKTMIYTLKNLSVTPDVIKDERYLYIFSVENINEKVKNGIPFREAYVEVASEIDKGRFRRLKHVNYSHTGSIGNLSNERILEKLEKVLEKLEIKKYSDFRNRFINTLTAD
jgi:argininosuccinate lyase